MDARLGRGNCSRSLDCIQACRTSTAGGTGPVPKRALLTTRDRDYIRSRRSSQARAIHTRTLEPAAATESRFAHLSVGSLLLLDGLLDITRTNISEKPWNTSNKVPPHI